MAGDTIYFGRTKEKCGKCFCLWEVAVQSSLQGFYPDPSDSKQSTQPLPHYHKERNFAIFPPWLAHFISNAARQPARGLFPLWAYSLLSTSLSTSLYVLLTSENIRKLQLGLFFLLVLFWVFGCGCIPEAVGWWAEADAKCTLEPPRGDPLSAVLQNSHRSEGSCLQLEW